MPFFHIHLIDLDWLHVVDFGISLDSIGCFFKYLIDRRWQNSRVLWCNRMPFVISSKTGLIYCGKAVVNRMMLGGSWTVICFSCHCGAQRHRQCSCPCHDLMHYYHSFEPIWWYNLQEWGKMSAFVVCYLCRGYSGLSRSYKDSCQGFKISLKILVVCQGVKDSSQRIPNSCQGG